MSTTHKLKLKRTPEEEAEHRLRKERRKEKKRKRGHDDHGATHAGPSTKKRHDDGDATSHVKWASSDEDEEPEYGPQPAHSHPPHTQPRSSAHKPDYDALQAEIEERMFREKMFDALGDDERLDSVEARLNDYAQVPDRWRTRESASKPRPHAFEGDDFLKMDPSVMDDEEYAEWIRVGMYRSTHAEEYAEQQRQKAAKAARRAEEKARKAEAARLEKAAEEDRKHRKRERESRRLDYARDDYHQRWVSLLASAGEASASGAQAKESALLLSFDDIPWPIASAHHRDKPEKRHRHRVEEEVVLTRQSISVDDLTAEAISSFLLPVIAAVAGVEDDLATKKKERKDRLREAFLRFHPDKFEGRFMRRVKEEHRERVREAIGQVSRVLNSLMGEGD
ncbi:hypothetical protein BDN70DRAFT_846982 [Pholiota conissans]|uniref:Uncharacterized protein n=1 Tax=Pholiota conissans TaxID=109636 RepID=A0A9P5ZF83_9AGAR|nr:hypothetical protein BDN70DRAFT_846982 [Pholiota conissans]